MYCKNCGAYVDDNAVVCTRCGVPIEQGGVGVTQREERASFGLRLLSTIPILGLIFFCVWYKEHPAKAKDCGIVALVSFIAGIVLVGL